jgi:hypothetical protein
MNDARKGKNLFKTQKFRKKAFLYRIKNLVFADVQNKKIMGLKQFFS